MKNGTSFFILVGTYNALPSYCGHHVVHRACVDGDRGGRESLSLSDRGVLCVYRTAAYDRVKTDRTMEICIGGTDGRSGEPVRLGSDAFPHELNGSG